MTRVLSSACVVLLVAWAASGTAAAGGKPPIAILGLEVYDNGGGIDPETTRAARELTSALRDRAKAGTGPYTPVQGGEKELIDEKLLNNCDSEAPTCMAAIGTELGAEVLMYGRIEKSSQNGLGIYRVSIKLLNVNRKQLASSTVEVLPLTDSSGVRASTHAKAWYAKLAGVVTGGTLAIRANIDRGTVLIDEDTKGNLASGTLTLTGISEGRHTLAIEAPGYQRYEAAVTVRTGETTPQTVTMVELKRLPPREPSKTLTSRECTVSGGSKSGGSNIWKPVFYGTTVATAAAGAFSILAWRKMESESNAIKNSMTDASQCGSSPAIPDAMDKQHFDSACDWHKRQIYGIVATGVFGVAMIGSFVMAYVRDSGDDESRSATAGRRKRREFAVTPVVTPNGGGATLRFDW
jgi:PEGA domain